MHKKLLPALLLMLAASIAADIVWIALTGSSPWWFILVKLGLFALLLLLSIFVSSLRPYRGMLIVFIVILLSERLFEFLKTAPAFLSAFPAGTFAGNIGGTILLKLITVVPVAISLRLVTGSWKAACLTQGDLQVKAKKIGWLGIGANKISWLRLSVVSGLLIALGTILLTFITTIGVSSAQGFPTLLVRLPLILVFAAANSACEGIVYRSAILGALRGILPKGQIVLLSGAFFGIAHYYGVPGGILGAVMSGILGWFMARSMYETDGFVSSWIIHFMQDVVIFSTLCVFGNFA
jgi:membrane protease YdiL (CAAX protease family)